MSSVLELSSHLHEVVVIELDIFLTLISGAYIHISIRKTKVVGPSAIKISLDSERLENERSFKACTDMDDGVIG